MGLIFWWMLIIWAVAIGGYFLVRFLLLRSWKREPEKEKRLPIAHSDRLTSLPEYQAALKQYRKLLTIAFGIATLALIAGIVLSARPAKVSVITPAQKNRDIMLCLDVSGSLLRVDATIINRFTSLVNSFDGQRIGLTVFNSSSTAVLPLTDDYTLLRDRLTIVGKALKGQKSQDFTDLTSGTLAAFDKGTSLVGDGLTSCINYLGQNTDNRSQSVILATDNEINGTPIITLTQAAGLAEKRGIRVYGIDPGQSDGERATDHTEFERLTEKTGGGYYRLNDKNTVSAIVSDISKQEARYLATLPIVAVADVPEPFVFVLVITCITTLVLIKRLRI